MNESNVISLKVIGQRLQNEAHLMTSLPMKQGMTRKLVQ